MPEYLKIYFGVQGDFLLRFRLLNSEVSTLWQQRMAQRHQWPLDHPDRFYNFGTPAQEQNKASRLISQCISTINQHAPVIEKQFDGTQDTLNYLHSIFEQYHGLLDQQHSTFWQSAPPHVRQALAELNLAVHRWESLGSKPRLVCTWFGMPKTHYLDHDLQQRFGTCQIEFGTVYLNYCEIGKTVEDLAHDNDRYISDQAFKPWHFYSADFSVAFYDQDLTEKFESIQQYIDSHRDFFLAHGIESVYNVQAKPMRFPIAVLESDLDRSTILKSIAQRQWINSVEIQ